MCEVRYAPNGPAEISRWRDGHENNEASGFI